MVAYAILAKYGPHRDALCKAYAELFDPNDMAKWHRGPGRTLPIAVAGTYT